MKAIQLKNLIREEIRKALNEANLNSATLSLYNIAEKYKTPGSGGSGDMPYPQFLELLRTGGIKSVIDSTAETIDIPLYDYKAQQTLTSQFKNLQQDLFTAGYKWIDGGQDIRKAGGRGGDLFLGINPKTKQIDIFRD